MVIHVQAWVVDDILSLSHFVPRMVFLSEQGRLYFS
jgi:hypothetical protein